MTEKPDPNATSDLKSKVESSAVRTENRTHSEQPKKHDAACLAGASRQQCDIEVFDFEKNWPLVLPHLKDRSLNAILRRGINAYIASRRDECIELDLGPGNWNMRYSSKEGPWSYTSLDIWSSRAVDLADEAVNRGEFVWRCAEDEDPSEEERKRYEGFCDQFYPKPNTFQWYQLWGACHWLAPWQRGLGKRIFPKYWWSIFSGQLHSFAYGMAPGGHSIIFDILNFEDLSAEEIIAFGKGTPPSPKRHHSSTARRVAKQ